MLETVSIVQHCWTFIGDSIDKKWYVILEKKIFKIVTEDKF